MLQNKQKNYICILNPDHTNRDHSSFEVTRCTGGGGS